VRRRKLAIVCSAGVLSLGLVGVPAAALADDAGSQAQPTVTQAGGSFTVTLPGVGSLSFSVDPTTHALTGLMVTPADPSIVAGTPMLTDEGVQVLFSSPTGAQTLEVEVEGEGAVPVVKAEADGAENGAGTAVENDGDHNGAADNENEPGENDNEQGDNEGTPPPTSTTTPTTTEDRSGDGSGDGMGDQAPTTTTTPPSTPTTTAPSGSGDGSNDGSGSGDNGDGGSGSNSSGDGGSDG
jgi:hypothetical protein